MCSRSASRRTKSNRNRHQFINNLKTPEVNTPGVFSSLRFYHQAMRKLFSICISLFCVFAFSIQSCKTKEEAGPAIFVTPGSLVLNADAGDLIEFSVNAVAGDNELRQVKITQKPDGGVTSTLKDTTLFGGNSEFFYVYTVPEGAPRIILTFTAVDNDGKSVSTLRDLYVNSATYLTETTGYELFSPFHFGSNNAFNLGNLTYLQLDTDPDSTVVDLTEKDETDDGQISRNITSLSGIKFVRNNSFNYAQASASSAAASYVSSVPQQLIINIQVNDILITEVDTILHRYAVIKFTGTFDDPDPNLDRYIFNIKK